LEKALAALFGEEIRKAMTEEWQEAAQILASTEGIQADEIIAVGKDALDAIQNRIRIRHSYSFKNNKLAVLKYNKERSIPLKASVL
jgi:head-tail adaptor